MKWRGLALFFFIYAFKVYAVIPSRVESSDYLTPTESVTVLRTTGRLCSAKSPFVGFKGFSFIQLGSGPCPLGVWTPVGWDRPEEEPNSPGIPFKARGL